MKAKHQFRRVGVSKGLPWTETTRRAYDHKWQTPVLCAFFSPRLDPTFAHSKMTRAPAYIWWKESPFFFCFLMLSFLLNRSWWKGLESWYTDGLFLLGLTALLKGVYLWDRRSHHWVFLA